MDVKQCYAIEHLERLFYKDLRWQKCYSYIIQMRAGIKGVLKYFLVEIHNYMLLATRR